MPTVVPPIRCYNLKFDAVLIPTTNASPVIDIMKIQKVSWPEIGHHEEQLRTFMLHKKEILCLLQ